MSPELLLVVLTVARGADGFRQDEQDGQDLRSRHPVYHVHPVKNLSA